MVGRCSKIFQTVWERIVFLSWYRTPSGSKRASWWTKFSPSNVGTHKIRSFHFRITKPIFVSFPCKHSQTCLSKKWNDNAGTWPFPTKINVITTVHTHRATTLPFFSFVAQLKRYLIADIRGSAVDFIFYVFFAHKAMLCLAWGHFYPELYRLL